MSSDKQILFEPSEKQQEFLEAVFAGSAKYILFGGAIRGGKTFAGLGAIIMLCKVFPKSRWAIVRDTLQTLKRNTIPSFNKICPASFRKSYNQDTQLVTFNNGSEIIFFGENYDQDKDFDRWKGLEVNGFLLEEANELQELAFYKAIERAGSYIPPKPSKKPRPLILLTCNPANNWVKDKFYKPWKDGTLAPEYLYIPSKITDNPFIMADQEYVDSLKNMPRYQYEVFVNGDWDIQLKTGGEFYKCFELDQHVSTCAYNPELPLHLSWDENVNPYLPAGVFQILMDGEGKKSLQMIAEIAGITPNNTVKSVCNEFKRLFPAHKAGLFVYGDATARKEDTKLEKGYDFYRLIAEYLAEYHPQLRVLSSNPSVVMRGNFINTILEKELYGVKITIDQKCHYTINDFILLKEAADGTKNKEMETDPKTKVRYQKYGHFADLTDYIICAAFAAEFARYQKGGAGVKVSVGKNYSKNNY